MIAGFMLVLATGASAGIPGDLEGFLAAQGQTVTFYPPVGDYNGWVNGPAPATTPGPTPGPVEGGPTFALVDYAGGAAQYLGELAVVDRGARGGEDEDEDEADATAVTTLTGSVKKTPLQGGLVEVEVKIDVTGAIGFAQNVADILALGTPQGFSQAETIFGNKVATSDEGTPLDPSDDDPSILTGADAARGPCRFSLKYTVDDVDDPFPDVNAVIRTDIATYAPSELRIDYIAILNEPEEQVLVVSQKAAFPADLRDAAVIPDDSYFSREVADVFNIDLDIEYLRNIAEVFFS